MRIAGAVAEYNPFHKGHEYHIRKTRENGADMFAAVMSGNFVQRGEPAIYSKYTRARSALSNGADLVIELPLPWAMASAEKFAFGGVYILNALGCIDTLSFGSECGDIAALRKTAEAAVSDAVTAEMKRQLADGVSFPAARQAAVASEYGAEIAGALSRPNDTLGVEYIKALEKLGSSITPFAVRRIGAKHDAADGAGGFLSASAIRESIRGGDGDFASMSCLETAVLSALRQMSASQLSQLPDVSEGLDNRIYSAVRECTSLESLLDAVKTRRYTHSRLRRIIMSAYLGLTAEYSCEPPPYIRVLGFSDGGREILRCAKKNASLPVVTKYSDISALGANAVRVFELECRAADLYALAFRVPKPCGAEMTHGIVTVEKN